MVVEKWALEQDGGDEEGEKKDEGVVWRETTRILTWKVEREKL